MLTTLHVSRLR